MKTFDIVRRAGRSLKHAKARTILTSLAIAVGAFTLTIALAAGEGARQYANTLLTTNIDPQVLAIAKNKSFFEGGQSGPQEYKTDTDLFARPTGNPIALLNQDDIDKIASRDDITVVNPSYSITAEYITRPNQKKYTVDVVQYDTGVTQSTAAGQLPELRSSINDEQIALPEIYVDLLGFPSAQDAIGKQISIHLERNPTLTQQQVQAALAGGAEAVANLSVLQQKDYTYKPCTCYVGI